MELTQSATYWETFQLFKDSDGVYWELVQNSYGLYTLTRAKDIYKDMVIPDDLLSEGYPASRFKDFGYGPGPDGCKPSATGRMTVAG